MASRARGLSAEHEATVRKRKAGSDPRPQRLLGLHAGALPATLKGCPISPHRGQKEAPALTLYPGTLTLQDAPGTRDRPDRHQESFRGRGNKFEIGD